MIDSQLQAIDFFARQYDYGYGAAHARKVADLAMSMFDQLGAAGLWDNATRSARATLYAAALAHDTGVSEKAYAALSSLPYWVPADFSGGLHNVVGFLVLRQWLDNPPLSLERCAISSADRSHLLHCVLWHTACDTYTVPDEPLLDRNMTVKLAGILRVAEGLDVPLRSLAAGVRLLITSSWIRILVRSAALATREVEHAQERSGLLADAFERRVFVQEVIEDEEP
jgi:hypothetical protein